MKKKHTITIDEDKLQKCQKITGASSARELGKVMNAAMDVMIQKDRVVKHLQKFEGTL